MPQLWKVIGGIENGGILVRESEHIASKLLVDRLTTGSILREITLNGERLHYELISGAGPDEGWVSSRIKTKELVTRMGAASEKESDAPATQALPRDKAKSNVRLKTGIHLKIMNMTGESTELVVAKNLLVHELKKRLAKTLDQPAQCLNLIAGEESMTDTKEISAYCREEEDKELFITMVFSFQGLYNALDESCYPTSRVTALQRLAEFAPHGCEVSIREVCACLDSKAPSVRKEAVQALMKLAGPGHKGTIAQVEARFKHKDPGVRLNAVLAWLMFLKSVDREDGYDDHIISRMTPLLQDPHGEVRSTAYDIVKKETFLKTARRGDPRVLAVAQSYAKRYNVTDNPFWTDLLWINPEQAEELHSNSQAIFLDARDSDSFAVSHIPGALGLPPQSNNNMNGLAEYLAGIPFRPMMKGYPDFSVIVYSDSGMKLLEREYVDSASFAGSPVSRCGLVSFMLHRGPWIESFRVLRLNGGLNLWKFRGLPVEGDRRPAYAGELREFVRNEMSTFGFELTGASEDSVLNESSMS
jgi:rhodanese-related sulfurtransferase